MKRMIVRTTDTDIDVPAVAKTVGTYQGNKLTRNWSANTRSQLSQLAGLILAKRVELVAREMIALKK